MNVTIVIPVLNEASNLGRCIGSAWESGASEVLVVDGGSTDGTEQIAAAEPCKFIRSPPGRARQQNAGGAHASGDAIIFLHADCWLEKNCVSQVTQALSDPATKCGAFRQRIDDQRRVYRLLEWGNAQRVILRGMAYGDQGIFVRRSVFEQLGGFPEMPFLEDVALMSQLRRQRWPVLLPGPLHVSARRWQRYGVVRQTLRNWTIVTSWKLGVSPERLSRWYRRHDQA